MFRGDSAFKGRTGLQEGRANGGGSDSSSQATRERSGMNGRGRESSVLAALLSILTENSR